MDKISPERRSQNMSKIRSSNTSVELLLRRALWANGLRGYRLHRRGLPGRPDVTYGRARVAVFIDGCFWHGCPQCYVEPSSNVGYWKQKLSGNRERDARNADSLMRMGWTVIRFWEHEVRQSPAACAEAVRRTLDSVQPRPR